MSIQEARSHPRSVRPSRGDIALRALALLTVLVFVLLIADLGLPLLMFSDLQWGTEPIVPTLFLVGDLLQLVLLVLVPIVGILAVQRYPMISRAWRLVWAFWGFRLIFASLIGMLAYYIWERALNLDRDLRAGPYTPPVPLPSWATPLVIAIVVLCAVGWVVLIPELIWYAIRGARPSGATTRDDR